MRTQPDTGPHQTGEGEEVGLGCDVGLDLVDLGHQVGDLGVLLGVRQLHHTKLILDMFFFDGLRLCHGLQSESPRTGKESEGLAVTGRVVCGARRY